MHDEEHVAFEYLAEDGRGLSGSLDRRVELVQAGEKDGVDGDGELGRRGFAQRPSASTPRTSFRRRFKSTTSCCTNSALPVVL